MKRGKKKKRALSKAIAPRKKKKEGEEVKKGDAD